MQTLVYLCASSAVKATTTSNGHCGQCMRVEHAMRATFASLGPRAIVYALRTALEVRGLNYQSLWLYTESASSWSRLRNLGTKFFSMSPDDPGAATSSTCITS